MSQGIFNNINPSATSGIQLAELLNTFKDAIASMLKASTRDPNLQPGGLWLDDSQELTPNFKWYLKQWTGSVDILVATVDLVSGTVSFAGADSLFTLTKISNDDVGAILRFIKKRISGGGQTQIGDILGQVDLQSTTSAGVQITSYRMKVVSTNATAAGAAGAYLALEQINTGTGSLTEKVRIQDGKVVIGHTVPEAGLHVRSVGGFLTELVEDSANAAKSKIRKRRISGNGQVLNNDALSESTVSSTDQNGAEIPNTFGIRATATQNHTDTAGGTKIVFYSCDNGTVTPTDKIVIEGGIVKTPTGSSTKSLVVGTHATPATNAKLHRGAAAKIQVVKGDDATAEGTAATTLAELAARVENFTFAGLPASAAANAGRIVWVTDRTAFYVDTGAAWRAVGSGGGGSSLRWDDGSNAPLPFQDAQFMQGRLFMAADTQNLVAVIKVPASYPGGVQLKASLEFYQPDSSGTVLLQTVATLIRKNTDLISSTTNQRTSTNSAITMTAGLANKPQPVEFDLTDAAGAINSIAVEANDLILVTLKRGTDTAVSDVRVLDKTSELVIG